MSVTHQFHGFHIFDKFILEDGNLRGVSSHPTTSRAGGMKEYPRQHLETPLSNPMGWGG